MKGGLRGARERRDALTALERLIEQPVQLDVSADDPAVAEFVRASLRDGGGVRGLVDLSACVSPFTRRSERRWIGDSIVDEAQRADILLAAHGARGPVAIADLSVWAAIHWIGEAGVNGSFGCVLGLFEREEDARQGAAAIDVIARALRLGLTLYRRAADCAALVALASAPAAVGSHADSVREWADRLATHTRSDVLAIHFLRRTPAGPRMEVFYRTDQPDGVSDRDLTRDTDRDSAREPASRPLDRSAGAADWVIVNDDWLLIDELRRPDGSIEKPRVGLGRSGRQERVAVRLHGPAQPAHPPDREETLLVVPVRVCGSAVGALSLSRFTPDAFDAEIDRSSAERFACHLASMSRWIIQAATSQRVAEQVSVVGRAAADAREPLSIYRAAAAAAGRVSGAARSLLLLDRGGGAPLFYEVARWEAGDSDGGAPGQSRRAAHFAAASAHSAAASAHSAAAPAHSAAAPAHSAAGPAHSAAPFVVDCSRQRDWRAAIAARAGGPDEAMVREVVPLAAGPECPARGAFVVFDGGKPGRDRPTIDDHCGDPLSSLSSQIASSLLESYPHALAQRVGQRLADRSPLDGGSSRDTPEALLQRAADCLRESTCADAVVFYNRSPADFVVCGASPDVEKRHALAPEWGSLMERCIKERRPEVIVDAADPGDASAGRLDREALGAVARAYGWPGIRSWLLYPVMRGDRCLGAIKLLTGQGGAFLDPCSREVVEAVAARTAGEMWRLRRELLLRELNQLTRELGGKEGRELAREMTGRLERVARRFVQPGCGVVVIATVATARPELYAASAGVVKEEFERDNVGLLADLGSRAGAACARVALRGEMARDFQLAVPIAVLGRSELRGRLVLVGDHPFSSEDQLFAEEAARELAIVLYHEHRRREWATQIARFRHFILGSLQGLDAVAAEFRELAGGLGADPEVLRDLDMRREYETEQARLWRENQRIYASEQVEVRPRTQPLRKLVERCVERFRRGLLTYRGVTLKLDWRPQGSLDFPFDREAIDLVLTNLIDNASKYCFYNREIEVGIDAHGGTVRIWVEDIGFEIPDRLKEAIYRVGERLDWKDPLRRIDGTGLGLAMARALVTAHGGTLNHTSVEAGFAREGRPHEVPHRVRFTVELPNQWRSHR